jgi:3-hydroxyacyl-CoA dehydrogenase/enoyl-CoA hydratase/3-hydroxybutyryl-CoA epimerase
MTTQQAEKKSDMVVVRRESGVALVIMDSPGKFNSLGSKELAELNNILDVIEKDSSIKAIVGLSGKPESFIIGADLYEIRKAGSASELLKLSKGGQALCNRISVLSKPFVVGINGPCLGGGLEIAMACHARVATRNEKTILGLPETRLGLVPGCGGTQRLPRQVGLKMALDMILSANPINAEKALEIGLVDELVDPDHLIEAAEKKALSLIDSASWHELIDKNKINTSEVTSVKATPFCLSDLTQEKAEKLLAISERAMKLRTKGHYPAQTEAIRAIRTGLTKGFMAGLATEAEVFAELGAGDISANLISLFFNTDLAKSSSQALVQKFAGTEIQTLAIIGSGTMGSSLAQLAAASGIKVILKTSSGKVDALKEQLHQHENISVTESEDELAKADMIIECVLEDPSIKAKALANISGKISDNCIVASNTSALSITELSKSVSKPENFLGVHFFHPVDRMPLVELIAHPHTSKPALARASELALKMGKTALVVKDKPGFLINRLLTVYLFELARLAEEQTPLNWIEDAMLEFGMPMGPLQIMDEIGIDVAFTVAKNLEEGLGVRLQSPEIFKRVCAIGMPGKRGNVGFYLWENCEKKVAINPDMLEKTGAIISSEKYDEAEKARITDRMILTMLDEASRCLEEKVVGRPREVDFALILGVGFPAFRGGLLKYADHRGLRSAVQELEKIYASTKAAGSSAERTVSPLLKKYAEEGRGFYSLAGAKEE